MNLEPCRVCAFPTEFYVDGAGVLCSCCGSGGLERPDDEAAAAAVLFVSDYLDAVGGDW